MKAAGIPCTDLVVDSPEEDSGGRPPGGIVGSNPNMPSAIKVGFCRLEGAPTINGTPFDTRILVFSDEEHLESLPPADAIPGQSLVYADTWEIYVIPSDFGEEISEAVNGDLLKGVGEFPLDEDGS
jgi:hypothetical protein